MIWSNESPSPSNSRTFCTVILVPAMQGLPKCTLGFTSILSFMTHLLKVTFRIPHSYHPRHHVPNLGRGHAHLPGGLAFHLFHDSYHGRLDGLGGLCFAERIEHHHCCADGRHGVDHILSGVLRRAAAHGLEHGNAFRIDVPAGSNAEPALDHGA